MYQLDEVIDFPDPRLAREDGLLAVGGDLDPRRLLLAYQMGIFPWYSEGVPILWHSPDPRMVLFLEEFHLPKKVKKVLRQGAFQVRFDTAFKEVVVACAEIDREDQDGTWITSEMAQAYCELYEMGVAHSVEVFQGEVLVGGLYGVSIGAAFFGESMFSKIDDASKVAFVHLVRQLEDWSFHMIDCQVYTDHLARFGAKEIPREVFLEKLRISNEQETRMGKWVNAS